MNLNHFLATPLLSAFFLVMITPIDLRAIDEFADIKTISKIPLSDIDVQLAHSRSRGDTCELVGAGELLETKSYAMTLTDRDRRDPTRRPPSIRSSLFSVGLSIDPVDQTDLPKLSKSQIIGYLNDHFVMIEARVRQDLLDRKPYMHHRPIAVTSEFASSRLTVAFDPIVAANIRDFHSLGMFTKEKKGSLKSENLRTLVLLSKNDLLVGSRTRPAYEFVFVQGHLKRDGKSLEFHNFITSDDRTKLHYSNSRFIPQRTFACTVRASIRITQFDSTGIFPKTSATRSYETMSTKTYSISDIQAYCGQQGYSGGISENLDTVLGDIILDKIKLMK